MTATDDHATSVQRPRLTSKGEETRSRIVEAAAVLMHTNGVAATSLDHILEASGTSKSQLYHYFVDKSELVRVVIARQTERVLAAQRPALMNLDSLEGLRRWRDMVLELVASRNYVGGCPIGTLAAELSESSEEFRRDIAAGLHAWKGHISTGIRAMRDRGELAANADPDELATAVMAALQGGLLLTQAHRDPAPLRLALDMAIEHVAHEAPRVPA